MLKAYPVCFRVNFDPELVYELLYYSRLNVFRFFFSAVYITLAIGQKTEKPDRHSFLWLEHG